MCVNVCYCVILESFESVIRCVSTCVISKCVMQMVCVEVCASKSTDTERASTSLELARGPALCDVSDTWGDDDDCFYDKSGLVPLIVCAQIYYFRFEIISSLRKTYTCRYHIRTYTYT